MGNIIGTDLRKLLEMREMSQAELARRIFVSSQVMNDNISDGVVPTGSKLIW